MNNTAQNNEVYMTEIVMPQHTNPIGVVFGGVLMSWIDIASAIAAGRHSKQYVTTKSIDALTFIAPIKLGWIVNIKARVNRVWNSSMEIGVHISAENPVKGEEVHTASAYLTMVAVDESGRPVPVNQFVPETAEEKRRWQEAGERKAIRLQNR